MEKTVPLTKEQMARRKSMNTILPRFNGNPLEWLILITAYLDTASSVCGFSPVEDMDRLRKRFTDLRGSWCRA